MHRFNLLVIALFVPTSIAVLGLDAATEHVNSRQASSPADGSAVSLIAQGGEWNRMMNEKCREWENSKNAPPSAAWTCVNGRAATQDETNEALRKFHRQGEQNTQKWLGQQRQQEREADKLIKRYSGGSVPQNRAGLIELQKVPGSHSQNLAPSISLPATWSFAHSHADLLMAIDVDALRQSPVLQAMLARLPEAVQVNARNLSNQLKQIGDVEKAWFSFRSGDFLALVQGQLIFPNGFTQLGNGTASYRISKTAVVLGHPAAVTAAVERLRHPTAAASLVSRQMKALTSGNAISMTGTRALLDSQSTLPPTSQLKDLTGFSLAMSAPDGLNFDLRMLCATVPGARRLLETMQKNATVAGSPLTANPQLDGMSIRIATAIPRVELLQALDKAISSPMGQRLVAMASVQTGDKVVVQGLPGGSKEIDTSGQLKQSPVNDNSPFGKIIVKGMPGGTKVIQPPH